MAMVQLTEKDAPNWFDWVANYDKSRAQFLSVWKKLVDQRKWLELNQPSLLKTHDAVMQKFRDQVPAIDNLGQLRNDVAGWLNTVGRFVQGSANALMAIPGYFGTGGQVIAQATGLTDLFRWIGKTVGLGEGDGLGAVPIIYVGLSIAGAVTALAVIADTIKSGQVYTQSMDAFQAALKSGATPEQAAQSVRDVVSSATAAKVSGQQEFMGIPLTTLAIAGVAIVLGPSIINLIRERR